MRPRGFAETFYYANLNRDGGVTGGRGRVLHRIRLILILALAGLILAGCGWFDTVDPLGSVRRDLGVPVTEAGRVTVGGQRVVFFWYQKGNECGTGHVSLDSGGAGWGGGACGNNAGISLPSAGTGSLPNGMMLVTIEGQLTTPSVDKVTITLADGTEVPAEVGGGMYFAAYVAPGGAQGLPEVVRVQGFDKDGKMVEEASAPGRR
jgi:hypothetical protein